MMPGAEGGWLASLDSCVTNLPCYTKTAALYTWCHCFTFIFLDSQEVNFTFLFGQWGGKVFR